MLAKLLCFSPVAGIQLVETQARKYGRPWDKSFSPVAGIQLVETLCPLRDFLNILESFSPVAGIQLVET